MIFRRNKVQPVPPGLPREVKISRNPWKKTLKWVVLGFLVIGLGVGTWVGLSANRAIKKITADGQQKSSLFSLFGKQAIKGQSEGRTNILLLGMGGKNHPGGYLSDTIIVSSLNYQDKKLVLLSLPRDLWVPIAGGGHAKLNEAYAQGENNKKVTSSGGKISFKNIEKVLGVSLPFFF